MANVSYDATVLADLREWGRVAVRVGLRDVFLAALREMETRLQNGPREWGDPLWDYRALSLTYFQRYGPLLIVRYAAHTGGALVYVRQVVLTPGSLLADLLG